MRGTKQHGGARKGAGRRREWASLRLHVADAALIESAAGMPLSDALRRLAAAACADLHGTQATLAPLLAVEAWDGNKIL